MKKILFSLLLFSTAIFAGCQNQETPSSPSESHQATHEASLSTTPKEKPEPLSVVTSFYPLAFFAEQIAGENAHVINLTGAQDPHTYKLTPKDRVKLEKADLVIYQGVGIENWTEDVIPELEEKNIAVLEASHDLNLLKNQEERHDEHEEDKEHDDHNEENHEEHAEDEHENEHEDKEHHDHDEHNHGEFDPHTWLDPILAKQIATEITEQLIAIDPENTASYQENLNTLKTKLQTLDTEYKTSLSNCKREALVSHNAFGYLENRYNFELHPIAGLAPSDEPSAKILAELKEIAEHDDVTHILTEENGVKKYAETLASETGITLIQINPMGVAPSDGNYFEVSRKNLDALKTAMGCQE